MSVDTRPEDAVAAGPVRVPAASPVDVGPSTAAGCAGGSIEVLEGGASTTVQDHPGRTGYWHVGVPPNGPMDDLSHRLVNRVVGNSASAAALELTGTGPTLRFVESAVIALGGTRFPSTLDGVAIPPWNPIEVEAGAVLHVGAQEGPGLRGSLAVRGGIDVPVYLGSRSTFTLGNFGGLDGRILCAGDRLMVGGEFEDGPRPLPSGLAPMLSHDWCLGVLVGPHTAPEFLTSEGLADLFRTSWGVHFNSARTGIRLIGPKPRWARQDGGEAGLHPSNIHDTGYAIGAVDLTGDMPVILGPDGPSLGGFVCPAVVATAERWKLGQLRPGDTVRFVPWSQDAAASAVQRQDEWLERATERIEPLARPHWNHRPIASGSTDDAIIAVEDQTDDQPSVTYRQAGDRFLLVEFGDMTLDLELRLRVHALATWVKEHLGGGVIDATEGIRSLLIQVDGREQTVRGAATAVATGMADLRHVVDAPFPSRVVHLPLSWDDPATRLAIERYMHGVRPDAPWCPWNIEFIRRINGLETVADVHRTVFEASYLVMGLGDVYLGAPVATPLDPRHRLVTTKYNPARTWTAENSVGIGGAYLCIYGMEGPGGYQFVGRTVQVWNTHARGPHFDRPWLLRNFDQISWFEVGADELLEMREEQAGGRLAIRTEESMFDPAAYRSFLADHADSIAAFRATQQLAFAEERQRWADAGEFDRIHP